MPELPEVESLRCALDALVRGRRIERVSVHETRLRYPVDPERLERDVCGRRIVTVGRRSKYLLVEVASDAAAGHMNRLKGRSASNGVHPAKNPSPAHVARAILVVHLGMSGRFTLAPRGEPVLPHVHVRFELDDGRELRFRDPRRFGMLETLGCEELATDRRFASLGPEPLEPSFSGDWLGSVARGRRVPVKCFIMDAATVVGVGNIYASEALHRASIHPLRAAGRIARPRWERLASSIQEVLREAVALGGTTLNDWQGPEGNAGEFATRLRVYGREGEPCARCGAAIRRAVLSGRSTYYCPRCQR